MNQMNYVKLLNEDNIRSVFNTASNDEKITICTGVLVFSCFVKDDEIYTLDVESMLWKKEAYTNDTLKSNIVTFICSSIHYILRNNEKFYDEIVIENNDEKQFKKLETEGFFGNIGTWKKKLTIDDVPVDQDKEHIHFKNGKYNVSTGQFSTRSPYDAIITKCIMYDYKESTNEKLNEFHSFLKKIYREEDVLTYICTYIGKSLIDEVKTTDLLFLYGKGGSGKSTIFNLLRQTLTDMYFYDLSPDAFDTNDNANRALSGITPNHKIILYNEPNPDSVKKSSYLKSLCDGHISVKVLYKKGNHTVSTSAKLFVTSNWILKFDAGNMDSGLNRRFLFYRHKNQFVNEVSNVDVDNFKFLASPIGQSTYVMSDDDKSIVFNFFAHFARLQLDVKPEQLKNGLSLISVKKIFSYYMSESLNSYVSFSDILFIYRLSFPFVKDYKLNDLTEELNLSGFAIDTRKVLKDINNIRVVGAVKGWIIRPAVIDYIKLGNLEDLTERDIVYPNPNLMDI